MNLSKIYRGPDMDGLQQFQFRSFGEPEPVSALPGDTFNNSPALPAGGGAPAVTSPAGISPREVEEAYARGRREGLAAAEEKLDSATEALVAALEDVSRLRDSLAQQSRRDMLRLVMAVAEQIIRREVGVDPQVVMTIIENALQASVRADQYRVRISPADLERVSERKPLFLAGISGLKNLSFEADATITPGGCRVDSELGDVDATLETQLETIRQALNET